MYKSYKTGCILEELALLLGIRVFALLIIKLSVDSQCSLINSKPLVGYNIRQVVEDEFPYVVAFGELNSVLPPEQRIWCSGAYITSTHILTAEHCFDTVYPIPFVIIAESHVLNRCRYYNPYWWISYNQWTVIEDIQLQYGQNDISILKTIYKVSCYIEPAHLLIDVVNTRLYGQNVTLVGWGDNELATPAIMEVADVKILTKIECDALITRVHGSKIRLHSRFLCTKSIPYIHLANGDSGGPLLYGSFIVAINTGTCPANSGVFHPDKVNVHLDIYYYRNFICSLMNL